MDERRVENVLGGRISTLQIVRRSDRRGWRATWIAALGAHAPHNGLLDATGIELSELMREIVAADAESMVRAESAGDGS